MVGGFSLRSLLCLALLGFLILPALAQDVDTAWIRRYDGEGNGDQRPSDISLDWSGNICIVGCTYTGSTSNDCVTIKYDPNGILLWEKKYNGSANSDDAGLAIATDIDGYISVCGSSVGSGTNYDFITIRYYPNGDTVWTRRYDGPGNSEDYAVDVAVDDSGNVYVTGPSYGVGTYTDFATIKYHPNGDTAWVRRYNGSKDTADYASAIAIDSSGNTYVTGTSYGSGAEYDYTTIKYYANGDTGWVRRYNGAENSDDWAFAIAVDHPGNIYVTGNSASPGVYNDFATIKYYPNGDTAWVRRYNGSSYGYEYPYDLAIDSFGNVYVTGQSDGSGYYNTDYATIRYYPNGDTAWTRRYNGSKSFYDNAKAVVIDNYGNVYVTGESAQERFYPYNNDLITIKYVQFLRGDANNDEQLNVTDVIYLVNYLFKGGFLPNPIQAGDVNCDGKVNVSDVIYLINYLFKGGPPPC